MSKRRSFAACVLLVALLAPTSGYAIGGGVWMLWLLDQSIAEDEDRLRQERGMAWTSDSAGVGAKIGKAVLKGFIIGRSNVPSSQQEAQAPTSSFVEPARRSLTVLPQPTEVLGQATLALRIIEGFRPSNPIPDRTMFVLNNSASGPLGGETVDFLNPGDLSSDARIDLSAGLTTAGDFEPVDMAMSSDYARIVVALRGTDTRFDPGTPTPNHLTIIETADATIAKRVNLPDLHRPVSIAVSPDGSTAYVLTVQSDESRSNVVAVPIFVVDVAEGRVMDRMELELNSLSFSQPVGDSVITPDGALLCVRGPLGVYLIDVATRTVSAVVPFLGATFLADDLSIHPHGTKLYAGDVLLPAIEGEPSRRGVAVIDLATAEVVDTFRVPGAEGGSRQDVAIDGSGRALMHLDSISGTWTTFDAVTGVALSQIDLGGPVFQGAISEGP